MNEHQKTSCQHSHHRSCESYALLQSQLELTKTGQLSLPQFETNLSRTDIPETCASCMQTVHSVQALLEKNETPPEDELFKRIKRRGPVTNIMVTDQSISQLVDENIYDHGSHQLGRFELKQLIGSGGMGHVYEAWDSHLEQPVAIKLVNNSVEVNSREIKRLNQEGKTANQIHHPGIIQVFDSGEFEGIHYVAMELLEGDDLSSYFKNQTVSVELAVHLVKQAADAIHAAHVKEVIHRDIKPANMILKRDGQLKIIDFGLAKSSKPTGLTLDSEVMGTPGFMAPEQAAGDQKNVTARTDVYGLGATLYFLLTGEPPYKGKNDFETLKLIQSEKPKSPRILNSNVSRDLSAICMKCLEKEPGHRYSSAEELRLDLEAWQRNEPISARRWALAKQVAHGIKKHPAKMVLVLLLILISTAVATIAPIWAARELKLKQLALQAESAKKLKHQRDAMDTRFLITQAQRSFQLSNNTFLGDHYLNNIPPEMQSWDTRWVRKVKKSSLQNIGLLEQSNFEIIDLAFDSTGKKLASVCATGQLVVWNVDQESIIRTWGKPWWHPVRKRHEHYRRNLVEKLDPSAFPYPAGSEVPEIHVFVGVRWLNQHQVIATDLSGNVSSFDVTSGEQNLMVETGCHETSCFDVNSESNRAILGNHDGTLFFVDIKSKKVTEMSIGQQPVTTVSFLPRSSFCIAGDLSGSAWLINCISKEKALLTELTGTIWDVAVDPSKPEHIAIAGESFRVIVGELDLQNRKWRNPAEFVFPDSIAASAVHSLHFEAGGNSLIGVTGQGKICRLEIDRSNGAIVDQIRFRNNHTRSIQDILRSNGRRTHVFSDRRCIIKIRPDHPQQIVSTGQSARINVWRETANQPLEHQSKLLRTRLGNSPKIEPDSTDSNLLWSICAGGMLKLYDIHADQVVHEVRAHNKSNTQLVSIPHSGQLVSLGVGHAESTTPESTQPQIRFWTRIDRKIQAIQTADIKLENPFVGAAVSKNGRLLAILDKRTTLYLIDLEERKIIQQEQLDDSGNQVFSAALAISPDGKFIAVAHSGTNLQVYQLPGLRRIEHQMEALLATRALHWSQINGNRLTAAGEKVIRTTGLEFQKDRFRSNETVRPFDEGHDWFGHTTTADQRRIVFFNRDGECRFLDPATGIELYSLKLHLSKLNDIAFDRNGNRLIGVNGNGVIEMLDHRPYNTSAMPTIVQTNHRDSTWTTNTTDLEKTRFEPSMVCDKSGRVHVCFVSDSDAFALNYWLFDDERVIKEKIPSAFGIRGRQIRGMSISLDQSDRPFICYVHMDSDSRATYSGRFYVTSPDDNGRWNHQLVSKNSNEGFRAQCLFDETNRLAGILHFRMSSYHLIHSVINRSTGSWSHKIIGVQGDGSKLKLLDRDGKRLLLRLGNYRFPGDFKKTVFAELVDGKLNRVRIPAGAAATFLDPDKRYSILRQAPSNSKQFELMNFINGKWKRTEVLPEIVNSILLNQSSLTLMSASQVDRSEIILSIYDQHHARILIVEAQLGNQNNKPDVKITAINQRIGDHQLLLITNDKKGRPVFCTLDSKEKMAISVIQKGR